LKTSSWIVGAWLGIGIMTAQACGPDFPLMLTTCRGRCLSEVKSPGFAYDIGQLSKKDPSAPPAHEGSRYGADVTATYLEAKDREPAASKIAKMRLASSGQEAYAAGDGLSEAKRLYTAGAVEFNRTHHSVYWGEARSEASPVAAADLDAGMSSAITWFERAVKLPADKAESRLVWATYMLARSHLLRNRPGDEDIAVEQYRKSIDLANEGHEDPLGLANFALGELAGIALKHQSYAAAVSLYLRQASAPGSVHAIDSLWVVARKIPDDDATLERLVKEPVLQKLLIAFALSSADHTCKDDSLDDCGDQFAGHVPHSGPKASAIVVAIGKLPPQDVQWPDQVAAIAYSVGQFELADRLLKSSDTPYADWLRAKLALHAGDIDGAARAFARASKGFATTGPAEPMPDDLVSRVHGETAIFSLSRSDYIEALYQLSMAKEFHDDGLYIAERVLTIDELKALVDKQEWANDYRDLLARRLMRSNRRDEALAYYTKPETKTLAREYADDWRDAHDGKTRAKRAAGWYGIAKLEVQSGMELLGSERCPDYAEYDGAFGAPCGHMEETSGDLTSQDEVARVTDSAIDPDVRFHYRALALDHIFAAADLLPRRSEILSSVLCNGASWLEDHNRSYNEDLIRSVYLRYVKDGRFETWAGNFGSKCPDPKFP
jgi:cellulose synthase operon protein C